MPPTAKEFDVIRSASEKESERPVTSGTHPEDAAARPQPVALEVPVTVNGARTVEGSDKREPFSESTQTVLVFSNGAVLRLASAVAPGQLLFLTNDKTKKEVVCQVVKSKNYRNVSGYVELEFTEHIAGFWGMRFPGERPAQPAAPASKVQGPLASGIPRPVESKPAPIPPAASNLASSQVKLDVPTGKQENAPNARTSELQQANAPINAPKPEIKPPAPVTVPAPKDTQTATGLPRTSVPSDATWPGGAGLPRVPEAKPVPPVANQIKQVTPISQASSETLKLESARLQEQLSSMLFSAPPKAAAPPPAAGVLNKTTANDAVAKVLEISRLDPARAKTIPTAKSTPAKLSSALESEEVKIPSWLEPLARNAATPATHDAPAKDETGSLGPAQEFEVQDVSAPSIAQEVLPAAPVDAALDDSLSVETAVPATKVVSTGSKGIVIGAIAAGVLVLVGGGSWLLRRPSSPVPVQSAAEAALTQAAATQPTAPAPNRTPQAQAQSGAPIQQPPAGANSLAGASTTSAAATNLQPIAPGLSAQPVKAGSPATAAELAAYKKLAEPQPQPLVPAKKPGIGQIHLATPNVNRSAASQPAGDAELAPTLNGGQGSLATDGLGGGLVAGSAKQPVAPAAPLPVGGDVKPARLISSVAPSYPALAKSQRVEGDVRIDALIDPTGRVSTMKVVSGPTLLHQAAMDALHQWKYQPATLDGKTVPMHLTVTIQFRLQ